MKIALLGNTCNNNFALMRYLRDLGADCHLLLYSNEGIDKCNPQYFPEWDTWDFEKWKKYIHRLPIENGIRPIVGRLDRMTLPPSKSFLIDAIKGYDCYVGSGISPGIFARIGKKLTIFYPYSVGVEWLYEGEFDKKIKKHNLETIFRYYVRYKQKQGIKSSAVCINSETGPTAKALKRIKKPFININVPQYYNREEIPVDLKDPIVNKALKVINESNFVVFSHMRHVWGRYSRKRLGENHKVTKNNHWLIYGFSKFISKHKNSNALLVLVEWGESLEKSKLLVNKLNISNNVLWIPLLPRKKVIPIMINCDISVGQLAVLDRFLWGSTTWESLANGMPTLQSFNFDPDEFRIEFRQEPPPFLNAKSYDDIFMHLCNMYSNNKDMERIGRLSKDWFDKYNGILLAEKWLKILNKKCRF